jgi:Domain of unknown function DUF29
MSTNQNLYDRDFYAWSREQAELLRSGRVAEADLANIAEEIESMGKTEKRELMSRLTVLLLHLAKWPFQPGMQSRSWRLSIEGQRLDIADWLEDNPSLRPQVAQAIDQTWRRAVIDAQRETGLDAAAFPTACPWSAEQVLDSGFWPQ